jgi:hypothetical protein
VGLGVDRVCVVGVIVGVCGVVVVVGAVGFS